MEEIKERLNSYRKAKGLYEIAKLESEEIETMLTSAAIDYSKVRVQTSPHDWTDTMARLADLHMKCVQRMDECVRTMEDVMELVKLVENVKGRDVLSRRYIRCQRWEEIAAEMPLDYRHTFRIHDEAIEEIKANLIKKP